MILVVSKSKKSSEKYAEMFNIMGYLSHGTVVSSAIGEISPRYRAIVILSDSLTTDLTFDSIITYASSVALKIPVFSIGKINDKRIVEAIPEGASHSHIIKIILRYLVLNEKPIIGKYKCAGFDCSTDLVKCFYFDKEIKLTKTEKMILRFLTRAYPLPQTAAEIIKYSIRPSRSPEPSSIRTHLSVMNKKFKDVLGRPMIEFVDREGYIIITPERKKGILR